MSLDEKPDFSEPELSEDDMKRLSQMGLDNIIAGHNRYIIS